ncbi:hypothetical protein U2F10_02745 [Leptothoe sp. EHU-05/26/07-4]
MTTLRIFEPGLFPVEIDISKRWGADYTVVIGVSREGMGSNHIAFRKIITFLSRRQVTILAPEGDGSRLMVRDGGREKNGGWSATWKHTYLDGQALSHLKWTPFPVGARLRFHPEKPPTAGYAVQLLHEQDTDNTNGLDTIRLDAVQAWVAISRSAKGIGTMLLSSSGNEGIAFIIRLDANAEQLLGAEVGELKEIEESCILNNLLPIGPDKERLASHVQDAMVYPGQASYSEYDFGAGRVKLRLENRMINNQYALLGWLEILGEGNGQSRGNVKNKKPQLSDPVVKDWKAEVARGLMSWAKDHPWLAAIVGAVLGIAIVVVRLAGD